MESRRIERELFDPYARLVTDFLQGSASLKDIAPFRFSHHSIQNVFKKKTFRTKDREALVSVIRNQYRSSGISINGDALIAQQLEKIDLENTFTITTGHQLCLFTGPLFVIYKILQCIKIADNLNKLYPSFNFIPVFWMASEDHDFDEVNHVNLFGKRLEWQDHQGGMVGDYSTKSLESTLSALNDILGKSDAAETLKDLFDEAYRGRPILAHSHRFLIHELFGHRGLVVVDGNDRELKSSFAETMIREIQNQFVERVIVGKWKESPYKLQVHPRPLNLFYIERGIRSRLIEEKGKYFPERSDLKWTKEELIRKIRENPENFSPNVLLRPMYQESILPNICYVGGPAEMAYWIQLKPVFDEAEIQFPSLSLRNSIIWIDRVKKNKLVKLKLNTADLFYDIEKVYQKLAETDDPSPDLNSEISSVDEAFNLMAEKVSGLDPSLKASVLAEGKKTSKALNRLKKKLMRLKKEKAGLAIAAYKGLYEKVFPSGKMHERYDNFVPYYLQLGNAFFDEIYERIDPEDSRICLIEE